MARALTKEQRQEIARKAAAYWGGEGQIVPTLDGALTGVSVDIYRQFSARSRPVFLFPISVS